MPFLPAGLPSYSGLRLAAPALQLIFAFALWAVCSSCLRALLFRASRFHPLAQCAPAGSGRRAAHMGQCLRALRPGQRDARAARVLPGCAWPHSLWAGCRRTFICCFIISMIQHNMWVRRQGGKPFLRGTLAARGRSPRVASVLREGRAPVSVLAESFSPGPCPGASSLGPSGPSAVRSIPLRRQVRRVGSTVAR